MKFKTSLPYFPQEDIDEILAEFRLILMGQGLLSMGPHVNKFENQFAKYVGSDYAVATASCTGAIETLLAASGVGPGDEVIVPAQTFIATASAVARLGATPVFAEVDENFLLDYDDALSRITDRTRAVILVHFAGLIHPRVFDLRSQLNSRGIFLFEDAAHAHGASSKGVKAGALADGACFSFYSTKNMTTGEGGMITTSYKNLADACASIRARGLDVAAGCEIFNRIGTNQRMTEFQALMGLAQLKRLDASVAHRNLIAEKYKEHLNSAVEQGLLHFLPSKYNDIHAYWRFVVVLDFPFSRELISRSMERASIKVDYPYQPLVHLQPVMKDVFGIKDGALPKSEALAKRHFCLPMHQQISVSDAEYISKHLLFALREQAQ